MTLELHATPDEVMRAVDALQELGQARQVAESTLFGLALALGECASNIVNHALRRDARQKFRVTLEHTGGAMVIELRDRGPEFDPTQAPVKEKDASDDDRPPGGWGIQLVRRYTDEMRYTREGGENVLRLTRRLGAPTGQKELRSETQSRKPN
jgi:serine/threonine-protein kinase RsbW